jgi:hypothetical protein
MAAPELSVALVNVLNGPFTLVAAGQVQIDVRPFTALFGKKALEKKIHSHWIDCGDAKRVTDRTVCRGTTPLHQNILLPAETNDVPDDQEISGKVELFEDVRAIAARAHSVCHSGESFFQRALAKFHCDSLLCRIDGEI